MVAQDRPRVATFAAAAALKASALASKNAIQSAPPGSRPSSRRNASRCTTHCPSCAAPGCGQSRSSTQRIGPCRSARSRHPEKPCQSSDAAPGRPSTSGPAARAGAPRRGAAHSVRGRWIGDRFLAHVRPGGRGRWRPHRGDSSRDKAFLATKVWTRGHAEAITQMENLLAGLAPFPDEAMRGALLAAVPS